MATLTGMRQNPGIVELAPTESVPRRPFTSTKLYQRDIAVLTAMLEDVRNIESAAATGARELNPYQKIFWKTHGYKRRVIVCRPEELATLRDICAVGFFGERRPGVDARQLERANTMIVKEFEHYPGILSYSSFELPGDRWANLVLHDTPTVPQRWRDSQRHKRAVDELTPAHYRNVRIHNCKIPGGLRGGKWIIIHRTKYWDYRAKTVWQAVRELPQPITA